MDRTIALRGRMGFLRPEKPAQLVQHPNEKQGGVTEQVVKLKASTKQEQKKKSRSRKKKEQ